MRIISYCMGVLNQEVNRRFGRMDWRLNNDFSMGLCRNCGEMAYTDERSSQHYQTGPTCASGSTIIYAWAMDADKLELPKGSNFLWIIDWFCFRIDVAFKVGGSTSIHSLVLQVHYASIDKFKGSRSFIDFLPVANILFLAGKTDRSGLVLSTSPIP